MVKKSASFCSTLLLGTLMALTLNSSAAAEKIPDSGCASLKNCSKCDVENGNGWNGTLRCLKCAKYIVVKSRECVDKCPSGYSEEWSTLVDYMGRICKESVVIAGIPMSGQKLAVFMGAALGTLVCALLLASAAFYLKHRREKAARGSARQSPSLSHLTGTHRSQDSDDSERPEFLKQLTYLKADAPIFLAMLNETRRQVRELRRPNRKNSAMQAYKPVLKDLSRILILLNRPEDRLGPAPGDWETLLAWGERVLRRYKRQNPDQVSHLLGFGQLPVASSDTDSPILDSPYPTHLTTFPTSHVKMKRASSSPPSSSSSDQLQQLAITAFDEAYNQTRITDEGENMVILRKKEFSRMFARSSSLLDSGVDVNAPSGHQQSSHWPVDADQCTILAEWKTPQVGNGGGVRDKKGNFPQSVDEDDFYTLGFRPQDEITTEL